MSIYNSVFSLNGGRGYKFDIEAQEAENGAGS